MRKHSILSIIGLMLVALAALLAAGCGGGGGSAVSSAASFFITDDLNTGYDAVWVSIKKVELISASGATVVFDDSAGHVVNVRALNSGGLARFLFLGDDRVPQGVYTGMRFTLDDKVVLFPTGASTGQNRLFAGLDANSNKVVALTFAVPIDTSLPNTKFVADFKLSDWTEDGTFVQNCPINEGSHSGLDNPDRHHEDDYKGTVSGLAGNAPEQTFTLNSQRGTRFTVMTDANTAIFNKNGAPNPVLADGKVVEVRGTFSPADGSLLATSIRIKGSESEDPHEVKGPTSDVNEGASTFKITIREAEGFVPETDVVTVQVNPSTTRFRSHGGVTLTSAEFFAVLMANPGIEVEAEGTVTVGVETVMNAKSVKIEDEHEDEGDEAKGTVTSIDAGVGSFAMTLIEWEGFTGSVGQSVNVTTNLETAYKNDNGETMTKEAFFAALAVGGKVEVKGQYEAGTIAATRLKLEDLESNEDEAKGSVILINAPEFKFDIALTNWEGFSGSVGMTVHVDASSTTNFRGLNGEPITKEVFFAEIGLGASVEAKGTFNSGTSTLTAVRVKMDD